MGKRKTELPKTVPVRGMADLRYQIEPGVNARDWESADIERFIRDCIQLQEGHESVLALPDYPMRKPAKEAALRAIGREG
jgi:hypothetical protein